MGDKKTVTNPFPGLRPFEENEYLLFFGREGQSDALVERLERARFLAVVGTSGSGKSSLVRAGLLPALRGGMMSGAGAGWRVAVMRPGHDPIGNLAHELAAEGVFAKDDSGLGRAEAEAVIEATLRRGSLGLVEATASARMGEREKLLVVADQFEELFRFRAARAGVAATDDDAAAFVKLMLEAARQREVPVYVVLTMRSDFLGDCAQFQGLPEAINDGQYLIPRMTRDERRFAIVGPARVARGKMTEPLVNRLLNDVGDNPDQLPILQHALMRTWDYWLNHRSDGEPVGLEHYLAVGTMSEALSQHADEAYNELPDERSRHVAELLFKALTERGTDNREVRRPTRFDELCEVVGATPAEVAAVIEVFRREGRSFLMPSAGVPLTPNKIIDISHESLIRNWTRLRDWVKDEAEGARIYRRLADAAAAHRAGEGGLLDDVTLGWVNRWRERYEPHRAWGVRYHPGYDEAMAYLEKSQAARAAEAAERERQQQAEIERARREREQAEAFAEQQQRAAQRLRRFTYALVLISLFAFGGAGVAVYAFAQAKRSEASATEKSQQLERARAQEKELSNKLQDSLTASKTAEAAARNAETAARNAEAEATKHRDEALAEKKHAEVEEARANEQAEIAAQNAKKVQESLERVNASRRAEEAQREAAEESLKQLRASLDRSSLLRKGLEEYRRADYDESLTALDCLRQNLEKTIPNAPAPPEEIAATVADGDAEGAAHRCETGEPGDASQQLAVQLGWVYSNIGAVNLKTKDYKGALASYLHADGILKGLLPEEDTIRLETSYGLAHAYQQVASNPSYTRSPDRNKEIDKEAVEQYANAEQLFKHVLELQKKHAAPDTRDGAAAAAIVYADLAHLYRDMGREPDAKESLNRVVQQRARIIKLRREAGNYDETADDPDTNQLVDALNELASFYSAANLTADAMRAYNEIITIQEKFDIERGREIADSYSELGRLYDVQDDPKKSEDAFKVANVLQQLALKFRRKDTQTVCADLRDLGPVYLRLERPAQARKMYIVARDNGGGECLREMYGRIAELDRVYFKDYAEAEENYNKLIELYESDPPQGDHRKEAAAWVGLGSLYANELKRPEEALTTLEHALTLTNPESHSYADWKVRDDALAELAALRQRRGGGDPALGNVYQQRVLNARHFALVGSFDRVGNTFDPDQRKTQKTNFLKAIADYVEYNLKRGDEAGAADVYRKAFGDPTPVNNVAPFMDKFGRTLDLENLSAYNSALEKYQSLLRKLRDEPTALKVAEVIKELRKREASLVEIEKRRQEWEAEQQKPEQAPAPTPSPSPTPTP